MRLYRIKTHFYGKDLDEPALLGYIVAEDADGAFEHIAKKHRYGEWVYGLESEDEEEAENARGEKAKILAAQGDFDFEYDGEFYDQKYGWDDLGPISEEDIAHLRRLDILTV